MEVERKVIEGLPEASTYHSTCTTKAAVTLDTPLQTPPITLKSFARQAQAGQTTTLAGLLLRIAAISKSEAASVGLNG